MLIINEANAPQIFVNALENAIPEIKKFAKEILNVDEELFSEVYIIDEYNRKVNERYSLSNLKAQMRYLLENIGSLSSLDKAVEIQGFNSMLENIISKIHRIFEEITIVGREGLPFPPNELIKEIELLIAELQSIIINRTGMDARLSDKKFGEINKIWKEITHIFPLIEFPHRTLGFFKLEDRSINICYKPISDRFDNNLSCECGVYVLAHEYFHALHYEYMELSNGKKIWGSWSQPAHIRRTAVIESLAEYFALEYAEKYLSKIILDYAYTKSNSLPFPNWGYAGAEIIKNVGITTDLNNPLFSAVFYSSVLNMEDGYRLLRESKDRSLRKNQQAEISIVKNYRGSRW